MMRSNLTPVMLCTPDLRRHLRNLCERAAPYLRVISLAEVATGFELRSFSSISVAVAEEPAAGAQS
jgi:flagellar biosynthesis protein FlhA